jgi:antitoxin Phd
MDGSQWSLQDAKNSFSAVVEAASKGTPQTVTKRGKPAVVVLSVADYEKLLHKDAKKPSFVEHLLSFPQGDDDFEFERLDLEPRDIEF